MYYEERIIDGILHFRTTPKGEWQIAGIDTLNRKLSEAREEVERLKDALLAIRDYDGPDRGGEYRIARDTLERIDSAMAKQPVNSSPERETVANREQAEGGAE